MNFVTVALKYNKIHTEDIVYKMINTQNSVFEYNLI